MYVLFLTQAWNSDDDDEPFFSPVMRKKAVKVKHVKRREKKFDKKVSLFYGSCDGKHFIEGVVGPVL